MRAVVTRDAEAFAARAGAFLVERPVEHNVLATVLDHVRTGGALEAEPSFAWVEADRVLAAALRTPPRAVLASTMSRDAAETLMAALLEADLEVPGVDGPQPAASYLADAWARRTGGAIRSGTSMAAHWLDRVLDPPRRPPGRPRLAETRDRGRLIEWANEFGAETGADSGPSDAVVDARLRQGQLFVWDAGGIVAAVGTSPPVAGVVRISFVYTPPAERGRGYASALVADVSRRALAAGAGRCMLYTDLANPTSNRIYQAVGYRRGFDAQRYFFDL